VLPLLEQILRVKKPDSGLPDSLLGEYRRLALDAGFSVEPLEKGLLLSGKTVKLALRVEFGSRWDFFNTITFLRQTGADIKVLVTSSNSRSMPMETTYTVLKKKLRETVRWVLMDIEAKKRPMFLNFSASDLGCPSFCGGDFRETSRVPSQDAQGLRPRPGRKPLISKGAHAACTGGGAAEDSRSAQARAPDGKRMKPGEPELRKTKNYGLQPADAPPRRKKIYGKRKRKRK
jgi:hypothetical protein